MPVQKTKPVTRQEIMNLAVTEADAFTCLRYLRHRENVPALPALEEKGQAQLPGTEAVLADCYYSLWDPEPGVKEEVVPDRRYWQQLLGQAIQSNAYQELHSQTQLAELKSVLGTIAMGESVLAMIPQEDQQKLQELAAAQQDANTMQQEADQQQAAAKAAEMLAQAAQAASAAGSSTSGESKPTPEEIPPAGGQPSQGTPHLRGGVAPAAHLGGGTPGGMTPEQAKALANQLAEAAARAKADAQAAKQLAEEAQAKAEQLANELLGRPGSQSAQDKLRQLTRMGLQAVKDAQAKVEEVSETIEAWGLEEAELFRQGIPEAMGLLERMKRNQALKKFAGLLGRIRKIAARKARSKQAGQGAKITTIEYGKDLKRCQPAELVALTSPALRVKALKRWTRGELRLFGQQARPKLGHGPVIVCEDASGSMEGAKQQWAKAVTLSLAHYAKLQKRSFGWILFDSRVKLSKSYPQGRLSAEQMLELAESHAGGGTDFERPLRQAMEMIQNQGLKKADICFITDGQCAVSDDFLREFRQLKKALEINIFAVLCDVGSTSDSTVRQFSDRVEKASSFTAEEAEARIFKNI